MKLITDSKILEFRNEYDSHLNVYFNGEPFSGILKEENEEVKYKSGNAIHVIYFHENGQKSGEEILNNGAQLESYTWYDDGSVKSEFKYDHSYYNESGTVLTSGYSLYPDGKLASKSENGIGKSFAKNGIMILESKWTPEEKYHKEYYLNGVLKYHRLPTIKKSFHYSDKTYLVIDQDETYGRSSIYFNDIPIQTHIHELYFSEGKEFGFSKHADEIRINRLNTWLVNTIQIENPKKYLNLNFKLCFCKDEKQANFAFKRLVNKLDLKEIENFRIPEVVDINYSDSKKMLEKLKIEINKK